MTERCPGGHASTTTDYCDQCGAPIVAAEIDTSTTTRHDPCPDCGAARSGDDRFCEGCGHDFEAPPAVWEAVLSADRRQWDRQARGDLAFPDAYPERSFQLEAARVHIGRSRTRPGGRVPEIDLAGTREDQGVSHLHALLERRTDGSYAVRDLGSTNGTTINDDPTPVGSDVGRPLSDGDRIRLGAWTTLTLRRR